MVKPRPRKTLSLQFLLPKKASQCTNPVICKLCNLQAHHYCKMETPFTTSSHYEATDRQRESGVGKTKSKPEWPICAPK